MKNNTVVAPPQIGKRVQTGIVGLDEILGGGFPEDRMYLIEGTPGTGKTTLALQFLLDAVRHGQKAIYVTLSETKDELCQAAKWHGWSLNGLTIHELEQSSKDKDADMEYTFFHP